MELRSMYRQLADRTVEIHVGNAPRALILAHPIIEPRRLAIRFGDLRLHHDIIAVGPFAGDLQLLTRIGVEAIGVSCRDIVRKCWAGARVSQDGPIASRVIIGMSKVLLTTGASLA